jgi:hypothetical protein
MKIDNSYPLEIETIHKELQHIKNRINLLEACLDIQKLKDEHILVSNAEPEDDFDLNFSAKSNDSIEFRLGEYGMAWLGNIVLLFGIAFLVQYLQNSGKPLFSALVGFGAVAAIYTSYYYTRKSFSFLSRLMSYNGHILLFYMTLQLHFTSAAPLIHCRMAGLFLLIVVLGILFYMAFRQTSQLMAGIVLLMILVSGIITNSTQLTSCAAALVSVLAMILYYRFGWIKLVFILIFLTYLTHLDWILNNPLWGNNPEFIKSPGIGYLCLILTGFIYSLLALIPRKENVSSEFIITSVVWNGLGFTFLLALTAFTYLEKNYALVFSVISVFCLAYSVLLQRRSEIKIVASMYALYGFLAMSVAFYGMLQFPATYMLLAIQSLLVVSIALWFRSRFIVVMNTILFVLLLIFYATDQTGLSYVNFSFMLVALITARIINWKKERLNIKTELIRNVYLTAGFLMTLVSFYYAFPESYITASWIVAGLLFFLMGRLLKNNKYRWLAIAALLASATKLIFVDLKQIDIGLRILMFLVLAAISIAVSILYTKFLIKKKA